MKISELRKRLHVENPHLDFETKKDLQFQIGKEVELARAFKNMTQKELAAKIDTQQTSISRLESGSSLPSLSFLRKIAIAFDTYLVPPRFGFMIESENHINYDVSLVANKTIIASERDNYSFSDRANVTYVFGTNSTIDKSKRDKIVA